MLRFNNNHIITGEIKQLLKSFNLPQVKVWQEGLTIFPGCFYIYENNLYVGNEDASLKLIGPYIYGQKIQNITKNLIIDNLLYDSYTHRYLGDYLRFYRDTKHIDLMSMYNCFSNELCKNLKIYKEDEYDFDTKNDKFKIYVVPVKWFKSYTIAIECDTQIEIMAGLYDSNKLINPFSNVDDFSLYDATYFKTSGLQFSKPFLYTKLHDVALTKRLYIQEPNLKLFIKVPASSKSSITVLEGDYINNNQLHFVADSGFSVRKHAVEVCNYESRTVNEEGQPTFVYKGAATKRDYLSRLQLLDFNSTISYPFADRLIEYLFGNVITPEDEVVKNVERLQKRLVQRFSEYVLDKDGLPVLDSQGNKIHKYIGMKNIISSPSVWTTNLRNVCYDVMLKSNIDKKRGSNKFDLIGYVDKDTEQEIGEYVEVTKKWI